MADVDFLDMRTHSFGQTHERQQSSNFRRDYLTAGDRTGFAAIRLNGRIRRPIRTRACCATSHAMEYASKRAPN